jgi:hypothetical protein
MQGPPVHTYRTVLLEAPDKHSGRHRQRKHPDDYYPAAQYDEDNQLQLFCLSLAYRNIKPHHQEMQSKA